MASWKPLSQFSEFGAAVPAAPPPQIGATSTAETPAARSGLPWDQRQEKGFFNAFVETLLMVLGKPGVAFTAMKREGGLGEPLIYTVVGSSFGGSYLFPHDTIYAVADDLRPSTRPRAACGFRHWIDF